MYRLTLNSAAASLVAWVLAGCDPVTIAFGTPPTDDTAPPPVDSEPLDGDGDGVPAEEDCDDADAAIGRPGPETWNGLDDNCDGLPDNLDAEAVALGEVEGPVADTHLGDGGGLSLGGDLTGDGLPDLTLGSWTTGAGAVWLVSGSVLPGAEEELTDLYTFRTSGFSPTDPVGYLATRMEDITADGVSDLLITGVNPTNKKSYGVAYVVPGGNGLDGNCSVGEVAVTTIFGDSAGDRLWHATTGDIDGDGLDDILTGAPYDQLHAGFRPTLRETGNLALFLGADLAGRAWWSLHDAHDEVHGAAAFDHLGWSLATADVDADGYADVLTSAPDARSIGRSHAGTGAVYLFTGNAGGVWEKGDVRAARFTLVAEDGMERLGSTSLARPGDTDGDGRLDLAVAAPGVSVGIWYGMADLAGPVEWSTANAALPAPGDCGVALATDVDVDGDGGDETLVGCPSMEVGAITPGLVRIFRGTELIAGIAGAASGDRFGAAISGGVVLNASVGEEFAVGAPGADESGSDAGAVFLFGMPAAAW